MRCFLCASVVALFSIGLARMDEPASSKRPQLIGHRGLPTEAPENTLSGFSACLDLRIGFEVDVRRSADLRLVCVHDDKVDRTTNGSGPVAEMSLRQLKRLDAGAWFDPSFAGERVPTLDEVFAVIERRGGGKELVALDLKVSDEKLAADIAKLARGGVKSDRLVCIGLTISDAKLREALREADSRIGVAVLAQKSEHLESALKDEHADWVYVRFVPSADEVKKAHAARKKVILVGPSVMGREPENWKQAKSAGVDAMLTDHPLECRQVWKK
jgi:glycerophosphoryl diester phosphodiesterase